MVLPKNDDGFETLWQELKDGSENIYSNNVSRQDFLRLYELVYHSQNDSSNNQLYVNLTSFLRERVQVIYRKFENLTDEALLSLYVKLWEDYRSSSKVLDEIWAPFNRNWVSREKKIMLRKDVLEVYQLALKSWKDFLMVPLNNRLSSALLNLIMKDRHGKIVNTRLISISLNSYIEIDLNNCEIFSTRFYKESFEKEFLAKTELFYFEKIATFLCRNPVLEFTKQIEAWFKEEHSRTKLYLPQSTLYELEQMEDSLLITHLKFILAEFKTLLECNKTKDLKKMCQLLSRVPEALDEFKIQFQEFVTTEGLLAIEKCIYNSDDPINYINTILRVYKRFNCIVSISFENEAGFVTAFEKACKRFINRNAVTENSESSIKPAELLIEHIDRLLKMRATSSEKVKMTAKLNRALIIFQYISEKDMFESYYSKLLVERFFQQTNLSSINEAENSMISKMKEMCKYEYAAQFQAMVQDIIASQDLNEQFNKEAGSLNFDFTVSVINSSFWSFILPLPMPLPRELDQNLHQFNAFYKSGFKSRKLIWLYNISRGELASRCFDKKYIFEATTFQIAVLLQFNNGTRVSFYQLEESTGLKSDVLLQLLQVLVKCKLLKEADGKPITEASWIFLNESYQNKMLQVNINIPMKADQERMNENSKKAQCFSIQAAIVRIAKVRKVIKHETLVTEVINQLSSRFKPRVSVINKSIEHLIEKRYLERADEEDTYCYVV